MRPMQVGILATLALVGVGGYAIYLGTREDAPAPRGLDDTPHPDPGGGGVTPTRDDGVPPFVPGIDTLPSQGGPSAAVLPNWVPSTHLTPQIVSMANQRLGRKVGAEDVVSVGGRDYRFVTTGGGGSKGVTVFEDRNATS